jgi:pyruvate/2-oxoglutarate dehydrogenase complex dihydrolipoamide dehydrogenase (E3) component
MTTYEIVVIGTGPAGHHAAIQAAKLGRSVAIIERQRCVGGACVCNFNSCPTGCPVDACVLRASCSAAHTPEQIARALDILGRVGAEIGVRRAVGSLG